MAKQMTHSLIHADGGRYFNTFLQFFVACILNADIRFLSSSHQGFIVINGFNLGRYWPLAGPQLSMYLQKELLKEENNSIIVVELEQAPKDNIIRFSESSIFMNVVSDEI